MDKLDRIQQLHRIFKSHKRPVSIAKIADRLQCTDRNAKRIIYELRDRFLAPIEYDETAKGWHYDKNQPEPYELPGLWLTSQEIEGFSVILNLLKSLQADEFSQNLKPIERSLHKLLEANGVDSSVFSQHIKLIHRGDIQSNYKVLVTATEAINNQRRLDIQYKDYKGAVTKRTISPLTLVHYCDNWYLDAWCHKREALRSFLLSRVIKTAVSTEAAKKVDQTQKEEHFASAYGIFAGKAKHMAEIAFFSDVAREVAAKQWHPEQELTWEPDNSLLLRVPYNDDRELVRDILKYGNNAEVLKPAALRSKIRNTLRGMWQIYG